MYGTAISWRSGLSAIRSFIFPLCLLPCWRITTADWGCRPPEPRAVVDAREGRALKRVWLSNQSVGFELLCAARDEDLEHADGGDRKQHSHEAEQDCAADRTDYNNERMELYRPTQNNGIIESVLDQLGDANGNDDPDRQVVGGD